MTEPQAHSIDVVRDQRDYRELSRLAAGSQSLHGYQITAWMIAAVIVGTAHEWLSELPWVQKHIFYEYGAFYMAAMAGIFLAFTFLIFRIIGRNIKYVAPDQNFLRRRRIVINPQGIEELTSVSNFYLSWKGVTNIKRTGDYLLFYVDAMSAHIIPVRNFPSKEVADAFYKEARAMWLAGKDSEARAA